MSSTGRKRKEHTEGQDEGHEDAEHKSPRATRAQNGINLIATCAGAFTQRLMQTVESPWSADSEGNSTGAAKTTTTSLLTTSGDPGARVTSW